MSDHNDTRHNTHAPDISEESFPIAEEARNEYVPADPPHIPVAQQLAVALGLLVVIFGATYFPGLMHMLDREAAPPQEHSRQSSELAADDDPFAHIELEGTAAYVWDARDQRALYNHNADEQLPLASVTKLMTALVAYELLGDSADVSVTMDAILQEGDSGLLNDEIFASRNLSDLTLLTSSNDGAYALAAAGERVLSDEAGAYTFVDAMNTRTKEIGLSQTYFRNPTGLDISSEESGAYGSARDMAYLMEYIVTNHPELLEFTRMSESLIQNRQGATHEAGNTNSITSRIPSLIASKTGYTTLAGGNLVVAFDAGLNHPVIISVLGSSSTGRFLDTLKLAEAARQLLSRE